KGAVTPLERTRALPDLSGMSGDQCNAIEFLWRTWDSLLVIRGGAGTGKTTMMRKAIAATGLPVAVVAPSADASRGELREQGFDKANTVASFFDSEEMQEQARGGIIWCDEAGMLSIDELEGLCNAAKKLGARLVLQGDPLQHKSVSRHGNMLNVL